MRRAVLTLFLVLILTGTAAGVGEWRITDAYTAPDTISNNSQLVTIAHVEYNISESSWEPVTPDACSDINVLYDYNTSNRKDMRFIPGSNGYFEASFPVNDLDSSISIIAQGTCDGVEYTGDNEVILTTESDRNLSVTSPNSTDGRTFLEGATYMFWTNVTNSTGFEDDVEVTWLLNDWQQNPITGGTMTRNDGYYNASISLPDPSTRFYYLAIMAANTTDVGYKNATGGLGRTIAVEPRLDGIVSVNNTADECNTETARCEKGADIDVSFNATRSTAENATGWVYGGGNNLTTFDLIENSTTGLWEANFTIPSDLNTTQYTKRLNVTAYAENSLSDVIANTTIDVSPFQLIEETASYVFQGNTIDLVFGPVGEYTGIPIDRSLIDRFNVSVKYPNGTELTNATIGANGSLPDDNYLEEQRLLLYSADIPSNAPTGTYTFVGHVTDIYGETMANSFTFSVYETDDEQSDISVIDISSGINDLDSTEEIEKAFDTTGTKTGSIVLKNTGTESGTVRLHLSDELDGRTSYDVSYLSGPPIDLEPDSAAEIEFNFSLQERRQYLGDITFMVEGSLLDYNRTVSVNFTVGQVNCAHQNGSLCSTTTQIDQTIETSPASVDVTLTNTDNDTNISYNAEGNLSDVIEDGEQTVTGDQETTISIPLVSTPADGIYSGNLSLSNDAGERVRIPVSLNVSIPSGELGLSIPSPDLGSHVIGGSVTFDVTVENTGDTALSDITVTNAQLGISQTLQQDNDSVTLDPDDSITADITFSTSGLDPISADVNDPLTLTAESSSGVTDTAEFQIILVEDIQEELQTLRQRLSNLKDDVDRIRQEQGEDAVTSVQSRIETLESAINNSEQSWDNGDYEEAVQSYDTATQLESDIEDDISDLESGSTEQPQPEETESDNGGGFPVLLIVVVFIILMVVGIIVYLSIVPEESEQEAQFGSPPPR